MQRVRHRRLANAKTVNRESRIAIRVNGRVDVAMAEMIIWQVPVSAIRYELSQYDFLKNMTTDDLSNPMP